MRTALLATLVAALPFAAACDDHDALPPPAVEAAETTPPCEAAIDAMGFQCADGHVFSARHDLNDVCVVVFEGDQTYVLTRSADGSRYTNGTVTMTQSGDSASLAGTPTGPHENCGPAAIGE